MEYHVKTNRQTWLEDFLSSNGIAKSAARLWQWRYLWSNGFSSIVKLATYIRGKKILTLDSLCCCLKYWFYFFLGFAIHRTMFNVTLKHFFFLFSNMESRSKFQATCKQEKKTEFAYLCIYILSIKKRVKVSEKWIAQQFTVQSCNKNANNHGPNGTHGCVLVSERNCSCKIMTKLAKTITKLPLDYFVGVCILIGILGVHDFKVV